MSGFSINSKGKLIDFNLTDKTVMREHASECAFDMMHVDDKLVYADWRIRKIVVFKNKSVFGTSDTMFKDYFFTKSKRSSNAGENLRPYNQILHAVAGKMYFLSNDSQLTQFDPVTLRCEGLGVKNLEALATTEGCLATLSCDNEITLLYQNDEPKSLQVNRPYRLYKISLTKDFIVLTGWNTEKSEATYLLYDSTLKFLDEISVKCSSLSFKLRRSSSYSEA